MNPIYLNPPPSPFPLVEPNEDQHLHFFCPPSEASSASQSSSIFFNPTQEQGGTNDREQQEAYKCVLHGGSSDHQFPTSPSLPTAENDINNGLIFSICKKEDGDEDQSNSGSVKWMPSNMRFIRKMVNSDRMGADKPVKSLQKFEDHQQPPSPFDTGNSSNNSSNNSNNTVRVCADCNTTKTPLWRSGPRGPKSLCNACGIRQRKARRAMAAAAAAASGAVLATETSSMRKKVHHKEKRSDSGYVQQYKKRCKLVTPRSRKKLCFEDFTIKLSKNSAFHRVFPQDEKEAAILLMALSCGLVRG